MKPVNINTLDDLIERPVMSTTQYRKTGWFTKLGLLLQRGMSTWNEISTPPRNLSKPVSARTWRRHSALISCMEEQYRNHHAK